MKLAIEVVFAIPGKQVVESLEVEAGTTLIEAIQQSGIMSGFSDFDAGTLKKGVWGRVQPDNYAVEEGDRVEIYRPLATDPKEARRKRANRR